jgi:hypothetical protein
LRLGGGSFGGSLFILFGFLGFPARPLLLLVCHDALPSRLVVGEYAAYARRFNH